ncbi:MAG: protein kinase [Gemmatimonadetes bacterium]|nr:protein kinase [Gemmatimonadota bacterium]
MSELSTATGAAASGSLQGAPVVTALRRGDVVGRYVIITQIGQGGMGVVYAAYDPELDRRVALKLLIAGEDGEAPIEARTRLLREAQALAQLSHPAVVAIHDVGTLGRQVWLAMEWVAGAAVAAWLAARPRAWPGVRAWPGRRRGPGPAPRAGLVGGGWCTATSSPSLADPLRPPRSPPTGRIPTPRGVLRGSTWTGLPRGAPVCPTFWQSVGNGRGRRKTNGDMVHGTPAGAWSARCRS